MAKKLTVYDATKEELITYFFVPDGFGGGFRIPAMKDSFLLWLQRKRSGQLVDASTEAAESARRNLRLYIELVQKANTEPDISKKMEIFKDADKAYKAYENGLKQSNKFWENYLDFEKAQSEDD